MGTAASQDAEERFSLKRMVANYVQFYQEVIDKRTGAHEH